MESLFLGVKSWRRQHFSESKARIIGKHKPEESSYGKQNPADESSSSEKNLKLITKRGFERGLSLSLSLSVKIKEKPAMKCV